jgi:hypothetical protein
LLFATLVLLSPLPVYAYGDPSGGVLFQILMPMLAGIWATWMIFANRLRRVLGGIMRKLRGTVPDEPVV